MKKHGAYSRPGAIPPWEHNRAVAKRKRFRRIARDFRRAADGSKRGFISLARAAEHAAATLRVFGDTLQTIPAATARDPRVARARDLERRGVA